MMKRSVLVGLIPAVLVVGSLTFAPPRYAEGQEGAQPAKPSPALVTYSRGGASEDQRVDLGFEITPVPINMEGRDPRLVGLGSYLVNAQGSCNDCHTWPNYAPGGDPFLGQPEQINTANFLAGGRVFGPFVSRNITPQTNGLPAGRTLEEFIQIMQTGVDLNCGPGDGPPFCPLLQVMPWPAHQDMAEHDIRAIYEYLSSIPHAEPGN